MLYDELQTKNKKNNQILDKIIKNLNEKAKIDTKFAEKLKESDQTVDELWDYIYITAKKKAVNGYLAIEENEVYGWAIDFVDEHIQVAAITNKVYRKEEKVTEDTEIDSEETEEVQEPKKVETPKKEEKKPSKIEDLFGGFDLFS